MISEDYWKISKLLRTHYDLFNTCWNLGRPASNRSLPTAGVYFHKETGKYLRFDFNPDFYDSLNDYQRAFVIAHECLHVILNHGKRGMGLNRDIANIAMDLVINHMLITKYGFDKSRLVTHPILKGAVWFENTFDTPIHRGHNFEHYYELLMQQGDSGSGKIIDDHSGLADATADNVIEGIAENAGTGLSEQEKKLLDQLKQAYGNEQNSAEYKKAGVGPSTIEKILNSNYSPKAVWNKIIKSMPAAFREREREKDTWIMRDKKHNLLGTGLYLPCSRELPNSEYKKKKLVAFMDVSGSCVQYVDRFYDVLNTVPTDTFEVEAHSFDTVVRKIGLKKSKVEMGGGTCFRIIEDYIQKNYPVYPFSVLVITDGAGTEVTPEFPERWNWVLTDDYTSLIPKESKIYQLEGFK